MLTEAGAVEALQHGALLFGSSPDGGPSAGTPRDAGTLATSSGGRDAGPPPTGTTTPDAGSLRGPVAGSPPVSDAGLAPAADAGQPDAGPAPATDAGSPQVPDAGLAPAADGGAPPALDAGLAPAADAGSSSDGGLAGTPGLWVTAYYPGWVHSRLSPAEIDFSTVTHLVDFSVHPRTDGTLEDTHGILSTNLATLAAAHGAGAKVLLCVGGASTAAGFQGATAPARLAAFVDAIALAVTRDGYDGVDLDWEPLLSSDAPQYAALVKALRAKLDALAPRRLMTAAVDSWSSSTVAPLAGSFDQVNVMTYDMASPGLDGLTWFNSPLSGSNQRRTSGALLPAADVSVQRYRTAGVAAPKLGLGIAFYGNLFSGGAGTPTGGVTAPMQVWTTAPTMAPIEYRTVMSSYYQPSRYHLDSTAGSAWLGIDAAGSVDDRYLAYEDEASIALKLAWVKSHGLGGVIIWQLAGGWLATAPAGQPRDPLLQAIKAHR